MEKLKCIYQKECGNCEYLSVGYDKQLSIKQSFVQDCFNQNKINVNVEKTVSMNEPFSYRNKIHLAVKEFNRKTVVGFFEENSNRVVGIKKCMLHKKWAQTLIDLVNQFLKQFKIRPYNKTTKQGIVRYVVAREINNNIQVTVVVANTNFAGLNWFYNKLKENFDSVSLYLNVNKRTDNLVFDKTFIHKYGEEKLKSEMLGVKFELTPSSFFQVNTEMTEKIYTDIVSELKIAKGDTVLDLFSGIGITSVLFAKNGAKVVSIEYVREAVKNAINNVKLNGFRNDINCLCGKCEDVISAIDVSKQTNVFLDPARNGAEKATLDAILSITPKRIVYMSCNPETLARDVAVLLKQKKYKIVFVRPYDMFPQTKHVETLAVLELQK